jgi:hypothetical protein
MIITHTIVKKLPYALRPRGGRDGGEKNITVGCSGMSISTILWQICTRLFLVTALYVFNVVNV